MQRRLSPIEGTHVHLSASLDQIPQQLHMPHPRSPVERRHTSLHVLRSRVLPPKLRPPFQRSHRSAAVSSHARLEKSQAGSLGTRGHVDIRLVGEFVEVVPHLLHPPRHRPLFLLRGLSPSASRLQHRAHLGGRALLQVQPHRLRQRNELGVRRRWLVIVELLLRSLLSFLVLLFLRFLLAQLRLLLFISDAPLFVEAIQSRGSLPPEMLVQPALAAGLCQTPRSSAWRLFNVLWVDQPTLLSQKLLGPRGLDFLTLLLPRRLSRLLGHVHLQLTQGIP
mmetsp:Transcript_28376/g.67255  ORF Transcript_28376/g.67255 Transcript_28376/m.67255 type:complete len:279 (-) Transcript_28376:65-901(-)